MRYVRLQMTSVLIAGALIGFVAAPGKVVAVEFVRSESSGSTTHRDFPAQIDSSKTIYSDSGANRSHLLAQADSKSRSELVAQRGARRGGANTGKKPNILVIFGDDIGMWNVGAYTRGMMGRTPNIDSIAKQGAIFTDHYGQPSCTAGRAAFLTGQLPVRTGMTTVGIPGSTLGIQKEDPTLAEVLKSQGYATGQFGKNHLGDRNEFFPTVHGFDEWFGNLYHLNAEEEPEQLDYPGQKNPEYTKKYGPRGVFHAWATAEDDDTTDPTFGRVGKQRFENTGPLTRKRMETFDAEVLGHTLEWLDKNGTGEKPFFCWFNTTAIHIWSHPQNKYVQQAVNEGRAESDVVRAKMLEHDEQVGALLKKIKDLGVEDNTIVVYTTDNGNELLFWPDGGYAPFRGEKGTTWEGGVRVPLLIKWPGHIAPGTELNGIQSHEDLFVSLAAAAGLPNLKEDLLKGSDLGGTTYKVHLDGFNNLDYWSGKSDKSARRAQFYYDETDLMAIRVGAWKMHIGVKPNGSWWDEKYYPSVAYVFNLLMDPMEKMDPESHEWGYIGRKFFAEKMWVPTAGGPFLAEHLKSLQDYPPRQGADSLSLKKAVESAMQKLEKPSGGSN